MKNLVFGALFLLFPLIAGADTLKPNCYAGISHIPDLTLVKVGDHAEFTVTSQSEMGTDTMQMKERVIAGPEESQGGIWVTTETEMSPFQVYQVKVLWDRKQSVPLKIVINGQEYPPKQFEDCKIVKKTSETLSPSTLQKIDVLTTEIQTNSSGQSFVTRNTEWLDASSSTVTSVLRSTKYEEMAISANGADPVTAIRFTTKHLVNHFKN